MTTPTLLGYLAKFGSFTTQSEVLCTPPSPVPGPPVNQGWKKKILAVNLSGTTNNDA